MSLSEVVNMAALQLFTLGASGPRKVLANLVHSEAYREAHAQSFLRRGSSSNSSLPAELLEHWKLSRSIYTIGLLPMPVHRRRKQI